MNAIPHIFWIENLSNQSKVLNRLTNSQAQLVDIHEPTKLTTSFEPLVGDSQKISILTKDHSSQFGCPC